MSLPLSSLSPLISSKLSLLRLPRSDAVYQALPMDQPALAALPHRAPPLLDLSPYLRRLLAYLRDPRVVLRRTFTLHLQALGLELHHLLVSISLLQDLVDRR